MSALKEKSGDDMDDSVRVCPVQVREALSRSAPPVGPAHPAKAWFASACGPVAPTAQKEIVPEPVMSPMNSDTGSALLLMLHWAFFGPVAKRGPISAKLVVIVTVPPTPA